MDQTSVKAEVEQEKAEDAIATSRRSAEAEMLRPQQMNSRLANVNAMSSLDDSQQLKAIAKLW